MSLFRTLLLSLLVLFGHSLDAQVIYDHQVCNYLTQKCNFDIQERYKEIFEDAHFTKKDKSLTDEQISALRVLQNDIIIAVRDSLSQSDFVDEFNCSLESIEFLFCPRMLAEENYAKKVPNIALAKQQLEQSLAVIDQVLSARIQQEGGSHLTFSSVPTIANFLIAVFDLVVEYYEPAYVEQRLKAFPEKDKNNFIKMNPLICIDLDLNQDEDEDDDSEVERIYLTLTAYPNETLINLVADQQKLLNDLPYLFYQEPKRSSTRTELLVWGGIACLIGGATIYNSWGSSNASTDPNECGTDEFAGPGCSRLAEIACRSELCHPQEFGPDALTSIVTENYYNSQGCSSISFIGGKDVNGKPYCAYAPYYSSYVGQMKPGAWECPAGKSPFHFLKDGRLCFNRTPIIRAGVDAPVCKPGAPYCKLPDGLTLFAHGDDMLLKPPCGNGVKICKVGDLKFYQYQDGSYHETSPCQPNEGVCVFDKDLLEFWNNETQKWQDKPVDYNQETMLYRFKNGDVKVFCKSDGSCSVNFPCDVSAGVCPVDTTMFYSKKGSGVWTEGMPCVLGDEYCMLENGQVYYPHVDKHNYVTWSDTPAWTGDPTNGIYQGLDGKTFVPNKDCSAWELLNSDECFTKDGALYCVEQDGQTRYWHNNQPGQCGWKSSPVCTGNERDGICIGPDGKVYILNSDLTRWIPERTTCKHDTALFCVNEDGSVSYWHRGADQGSSGSWHDVPDCADFAGQGYCVGPDGRMFKFDQELGRFVYIGNPVDATRSQLIKFGNKNYAVWDPAQSKWLLNDAPCNDAQHDVGYCPLDDGNELYAHVDQDSNKSWQLDPQVDDSINVIKLGDNTKRWRQVADDSDNWTKVMPCPQSDEKYVVSREVYDAAKLNQTETGRAQIMLDPDTCVQVKPDNLQPYCPDSKVIPTSNQVALGDKEVHQEIRGQSSNSEQNLPTTGGSAHQGDASEIRIGLASGSDSQDHGEVLPGTDESDESKEETLTIGGSTHQGDASQEQVILTEDSDLQDQREVLPETDGSDESKEEALTIAGSADQGDSKSGQITVTDGLDSKNQDEQN